MELPREYKEKGFYFVRSILNENKKYIKCGNENDNIIYFFEIKDGKIEKINNEKDLNFLLQNYTNKTNTRIIY